MSKSTFHYAEKSNCEQEKDDFSNMCAEGLLEHTPDDLSGVVLTADTMSDLSMGLGLYDAAGDAEGEDQDLGENLSLEEEDPPYLDDEIDECVIEGTTGHTLHHKSRQLRALADSLVTKNGIVSMACLLASKW
jgi:hypothetical protein